jgi:hypothetical protein
VWPSSRDPLQGRVFGVSLANFCQRARECFAGDSAAAFDKRRKKNKGGFSDWIRFIRALQFERKYVSSIHGPSPGVWDT